MRTERIAPGKGPGVREVALLSLAAREVLASHTRRG